MKGKISKNVPTYIIEMKNRAINDAFLEIFSFNPHAFWLQALEANSNKNQIAIVFVDFASITLLYFKDIDIDISTNIRLHFHLLLFLNNF